VSLVRTALQAGLAHTRGSLRFVFLAWATSLLVALPLGLAMFAALRGDLGHEIAAENLRVGWDDAWHRAFAAQAHGIEGTFDAGIVGVGALLRALDSQLAGALLGLPAPIVAAGLVYAAVWVLLSGGFVGRFVHGHDPAAPGFWLGAVRSFRPLATLAVVMGAGYWVVLGPLRGALGAIVEDATRDTIDERVHFAWVLGKIAIVWGLAWGISLVHDYARVLRVVDSAKPLPRVLVESARFVAGRARSVLGLSLAVFAIGVALLAGWAVIAPGATQSHAAAIVLGFAVSQLSVLVRIAVRVLGWASQVALMRPRKGP
jgi:hypothetical protein